MEAYMAIWASALQAMADESKQGHVCLCVTHRHISHNLSSHSAILVLFSPSQKLWSRNPPFFGGSFVFLLIFSVSILSPWRLWDVFQKEMLTRWQIFTLERQIGCCIVWETQSYSTWELDAQYMPLFLPSASSHIPTQSPERRTGRHHLWVGPMLYDYVLPSL